MATKKATKKSSAKKSSTKKASSKKSSTKKASTKKSATKKSTSHKTASKKTASKKSASKKGAKKSSTRKYSPSAGNDVKKEMHDFKRGKANSGPGGKGGKVQSRKQAIAIGLSKARKEGKKVPAKKS